MGTWGYQILEDDGAADAYGEYIDHFNLGLTAEGIRQRLDKNPLFRNRVLEDNTPFWLGLAQAQWECGALDEDILALVKKALDDDLEQEIWEETYPARKKVLVRFLKKISVPNKKPHKRVKPKLYSLPFQTGDCLAFRYADGMYGAAVCLAGPPGKRKYASAILATTRIHQAHLPTQAEVAASHVMMKEWFDSGLREPAVDVRMISDQKSAMEAQSLAVIGNLQITRSFGDRLYGCHLAWNLEFAGNLQFPWEVKNLHSPWKLQLPIANFINQQENDWCQLGETFARVMQERQDATLDHQLRAQFAELWRQATAGTKQSQSLEFLANYTGCRLDRIETWVNCYVKG